MHASQTDLVFFKQHTEQKYSEGIFSAPTIYAEKLQKQDFKMDFLQQQR